MYFTHQHTGQTARRLHSHTHKQIREDHSQTIRYPHQNKPKNYRENTEKIPVNNATIYQNNPKIQIEN